MAVPRPVPTKTMATIVGNPTTALRNKYRIGRQVRVVHKPGANTVRTHDRSDVLVTYRLQYQAFSTARKIKETATEPAAPANPRIGVNAKSPPMFKTLVIPMNMAVTLGWPDPSIDTVSIVATEIPRMPTESSLRGQAPCAANCT